MNKPLNSFAPKKIETILLVYLKIKQRQTENMEIKLPLATLFLSNGTQINGRVSDCDLSQNLLSFAVNISEGSTDICYMRINQIAAITLHDLNLCPEFLRELNQS